MFRTLVKLANFGQVLGENKCITWKTQKKRDLGLVWREKMLLTKTVF